MVCFASGTNKIKAVVAQFTVTPKFLVVLAILSQATTRADHLLKLSFVAVLAAVLDLNRSAATYAFGTCDDDDGARNIDPTLE